MMARPNYMWILKTVLHFCLVLSSCTTSWTSRSFCCFNIFVAGISFQTSSETGGTTRLINKNAISKQHLQDEATLPPRGFTTCLNFLRNRKAEFYSGEDFVDLIKSMCHPAVKSGRAAYRYKHACSLIEQSVRKKYASSTDWDPALICNDIMTTFDSYAPKNTEGFRMDNNRVDMPDPEAE